MATARCPVSKEEVQTIATDCITLTDGRRLAFLEYGDPSGRPVIFCHGFSDSSRLRHPDNEVVRSLGVRVLAADQPGVGRSSPKPGRSMVEWGADMEELADHLGLEEFAVVGHSGGGPQALAVAHRLPGRVSAVTLASPVADFAWPGVTKLLRNKDLRLVVRLRRFHRMLRWSYRYGARQGLADVDRFIDKTVKDDPSDAEVLAGDPDRRRIYAESLRAGLAQGGEGMYELTQALWDWGFDPSHVETPVRLFWSGEDQIIDPAMSRLLADRLANCQTREWPDAGHYGFLGTEAQHDVFGS